MQSAGRGGKPSSLRLPAESPGCLWDSEHTLGKFRQRDGVSPEHSVGVTGFNCSLKGTRYTGAPGQEAAMGGSRHGWGRGRGGAGRWAGNQASQPPMNLSTLRTPPWCPPASSGGLASSAVTALVLLLLLVSPLRGSGVHTWPCAHPRPSGPGAHSLGVRALHPRSQAPLHRLHRKVVATEASGVKET